MDAAREDPAAVAVRAWKALAEVFFSRRGAWIAAGRAEGLTPPHAIALLKLDPDGPPTLTELARTMHCDASWATSIADVLEERGLVERRVSAADRRVRELVPTAEGLAVQERLRAVYSAAPAGIEDTTAEEARALAALAERLAARIRPDG